MGGASTECCATIRAAITGEKNFTLLRFAFHISHDGQERPGGKKNDNDVRTYIRCESLLIPTKRYTGTVSNRRNSTLTEIIASAPNVTRDRIEKSVDIVRFAIVVAATSFVFSPVEWHEA